jgi:transposase InsO family protein
MRYAFIEEHRGQFPIRRMCRVLEVDPSGYYAWHQEPESARCKRDRPLIEHIRRVHQHSRKKAYGSPRITQDLKAEGIVCSRNRVARLMRACGIQGKPKRRFRVLTKGGSLASRDLVKQQFQVNKPDKVWASDITYIRTRRGYLYLCVVLDLFARKVVGWSTGRLMTADLVLRAFRMACRRRKPQPGLIFHSDRGNQFTSEALRAELDKNGFRSSMARKGNCYDNAVVESFFARLKTEEVDGMIYPDREQAALALFEYIEGFYNKIRRHSYINQMSPDDFEQQKFT